MRVTAHLLDGRVNSSDGILMLDGILYHAWFAKYKPETFLVGHDESVDIGHIGLPLTNTDGINHASMGIYTTLGTGLEMLHKVPNIVERIDLLEDKSGTVDLKSGKFKAYRIAQNIITTNKIIFYCRGNAEKIKELLTYMDNVGKKYSIGYGIVKSWEVEEAEKDYSFWHDEHKLMRPFPTASTATLLRHILANDPNYDGSLNFAISEYTTKPPYWKSVNARECYLPNGV